MGGSPWPRWASGLAQGAYDLATAYAKERQQFGKPIAKFQAVAFKLADMAVEIEAGRQLVLQAAWLKDQGRPFALEAAMAKLYTGELSHRVVNHALQIHGGYGFMDEFPISRLYRDQKILEIGEGTNEVQRLVIARLLGLSPNGAKPRGLAPQGPVPRERHGGQSPSGTDPTSGAPISSTDRGLSCTLGVVRVSHRSSSPQSPSSLAAASTATGHVTIAPPFVELDEQTELAFETPNERAPRVTTSLELVAPPGVELAAAPAPEGWSLSLEGTTARWSGGTIEADDVVAFPLLVTARDQAGTEVFRARQRYDDGAVVRWTARLTVVPASAEEPEQQLGRAFVAGAVGLVVLVGSLVVVRRLRR